MLRDGLFNHTSLRLDVPDWNSVGVQFLSVEIYWQADQQCYTTDTCILIINRSIMSLKMSYGTLIIHLDDVCAVRFEGFLSFL